MSQVLQEAQAWLGVVIIFGVPMVLAWWLSDGFAGWQWDAAPPQVEYKMAYDPRTDHWSAVAVDSNSGASYSSPF